jgi:hypothetical protein
MLSYTARLLLIVLLAVTVAGCEVVGGIFKAGVGVGAFAVILVVLLIVFAVVKMKG